MLKKAIVWGTVAAGVIAAIKMYKRGESLPNIARKAGLHPVDSFVNEIRGNRA